MYSVEKRKRTRMVTVSLGWHLGLGFVTRNFSGRYESWLLLSDGKHIADFRNEKLANDVANKLNEKQEQSK